MNAPISMDKTDGIIAALGRDSRAPFNRVARPFITISRECCAGGSSLAQLLAERLSGEGKWSVYNGNVVGQMLQTHHLPEKLAHFLPEDTIPEVNATIGEVVGLHPNLWELVQNTKATIHALALHGNTILVGRGANFVTADLQDGIHVRLVAPAAHRARYHATRFRVSDKEALEHIAKCDAARRRYVQANFSADIADASAYDLVINSARVPLAEAADLIIQHLHARMAREVPA